MPGAIFGSIDLEILIHPGPEAGPLAIGRPGRLGWFATSGRGVGRRPGSPRPIDRTLRRLLRPIVEGKADVVHGSRSIGESRRVLHFGHSMGDRSLTILSNMFTDPNLTDMEVCRETFRREVIRGIAPKGDRFGFEPEVTAEVARFRAPPIDGRRGGAGSSRSRQLQRAGPRRGGEDRPEGRGPGPVSHREICIRGSRFEDRGPASPPGGGFRRA